MKLHYDKEADAVYIYLNKGKIFNTKKIGEGLIVDFNKRGGVVGIELLFVSLQFTKAQINKLTPIKPLKVFQMA